MDRINQEIKHIFDSGANEIRVEEMTKKSAINFGKWLCESYVPQVNNSGDPCWVHQDHMEHPFPIPKSEYYTTDYLFQIFNLSK